MMTSFVRQVFYWPCKHIARLGRYRVPLSQKPPPWEVGILAVVVMVSALQLPPSGGLGKSNLSAVLITKTVFVSNYSEHEYGKRSVPNQVFLRVMHDPISSA